MPKGFRSPIYAEDPNLTSIEILAWAAKRDVFMTAEAYNAFEEQLAFYAKPRPWDPDGRKSMRNEILERVRKLVKSDMVVVVTSGYLQRLVSSKGMDGGTAADLEERMAKERQARTVGRKPRFYCVTEAGRKYLETRQEDLKEILRKRRRK